MSDRSITIDLYKKDRSFQKHNKKYFSDDNPPISDAEYDALKEEILSLEKDYIFLKKLNLSSKIVGTPPSNKFKKNQTSETNAFFIKCF